jgi:quercetin dioxygenase-like cupin family protein
VAKLKPGQGIPSYEASPDEYKVICENMTGKLVHMRLKAGESDKPHDHATHYMYVLKGGTVDIDSETEPKGVKTLPSGAAVKMPPGPHQVTNVGKEDIEMLMVEVTGELGPSPEGHVSPLSTDPKCYEVMFEDEDWFVGKMTMKAGTQDHAHSHRHHLIYAAAGDQLTIYPGEDANMQAGSDKKLVVDIKPGMAFPAPDGFHIVANSGKQDCKLIFWEPKVKQYVTLSRTASPLLACHAMIAEMNKYNIEHRSHPWLSSSLDKAFLPTRPPLTSTR